MRSRSLRLDACLRSTRSGVADLGKDMWGFTNVPVRTVEVVWAIVYDCRLSRPSVRLTFKDTGFRAPGHFLSHFLGISYFYIVHAHALHTACGALHGVSYSRAQNRMAIFLLPGLTVPRRGK